MTKQQFDKLMDKHLNGSASQQEEQELFDWYALMQERATEDKVLVAEEIKILFEQMEARIAVPASSGKISWGWIGIAAAILLVVFTSLAGMFIFKKEHAGLKLANIITLKDQKRKLILPDGTLVWLNALSQLKYPLEFTGTQRELWLSGEAYFEVKHNASKPFIVHASGLAVRVLGTVFNLKAYPGKQTETSLLKGSVEVTFNYRLQQTVRLKPYQKLLAVDQKNAVQNKTPPVLNIETIKHDQTKPFIAETAWTQQKFSFSNENLAAITQKLEQVYGIKITFQHPRLREIRFTGTFDNASISTVLNALQFSNEFEYRKEGEETIIIY